MMITTGIPERNCVPTDTKSLISDEIQVEESIQQNARVTSLLPLCNVSNSFDHQRTIKVRT
jgi:hypothetical protein